MLGWDTAFGYCVWGVSCGGAPGRASRRGAGGELRTLGCQNAGTPERWDARTLEGQTLGTPDASTEACGRPALSSNPRIPFYTLCKTFVFLYLALGSRGTPYVYNTILAPLFHEHEPAIDEFIAGVRGQAGSHARGTFGWLYDFIRRQLGVSRRGQKTRRRQIQKTPR